MSNLKEAMGSYSGITYPFHWLFNDWLYGIWKRLMCKRNMHLFDEVVSSGSKDGHYLHCDACELMIVIKRVDTTYVKHQSASQG